MIKKNLSRKTGLSARKAAWDVLQAVSAGAYADVALDRAIKKYSLTGLDRSLTTELAYGSIRYRYLLDGWIDYLGKVSARKQPPLLRWLLHIGLYQILYMKRIPVSAGINTTVEIAKGSQLKRLTSVVNGFLRNVNRHLLEGKSLPVPSSLPNRLALSYSFPCWLIEEFLLIFGKKITEDIVTASNKAPTFDLRVNRLKTTPHAVKKNFEKIGIETDFIDASTEGLQLNSGLAELLESTGYHHGEWCVQDRSSQWIASLLEPQPGDRILDACSAPGSKTTHVAALIGNRGEIWAVDRSSERLKLVVENAARLGANSIKTFVADAVNLLNKKPEWEGYFQRILVDAPCSGLGTLARHPDARWRITPKKIEELILLQEQLLKGVRPLLAARGRLVYSTCTILPGENQDQIHRFLETCPELRLICQQQILPSEKKSGDGFYAAVLEKD